MKRLFPNLAGATALLLVLAVTGAFAATSHRSGDRFQIERSDLQHTGNDYVESIDMTFKVEERGALSLGTTNGAINVRTWSENMIRLVVDKRTVAADAKDARRILDMFRVQVLRGGDDLAFTARARTTECARSVGVTFTVWVPKTYDVDIRTDNGDIEIPRMQGRFAAHTSEGKISVDCDTDNLDIEVEDNSDEEDSALDSTDAESGDVSPVDESGMGRSPGEGPAESSDDA